MDLETESVGLGLKYGLAGANLELIGLEAWSMGLGLCPEAAGAGLESRDMGWPDTEARLKPGATEASLALGKGWSLRVWSWLGAEVGLEMSIQSQPGTWS